MRGPELVRFEIEGADMAVRLAGDREKPALLLLHGLPNSSGYFRNVVGTLARDCFVIAPDLPGFGGSEPVERPSFSRFADLIDALLARLGVGGEAGFYLYVHDFGAAVGLHLATRAPHRILGLIIQNANAHESGMGPQWVPVRAYWADPTPEREAEATAFLTFEGTRKQYVGGIPEDIAARIDPRLWEEDWRIMSLPGRRETHRALVLDNRSHVARFGEIANYLARWQPPALMLWGRHDIFFELEETLSWMKALPRMEAHILDGPHLLLETHAAECATLMSDFIRRVGASDEVRLRDIEPNDLPIFYEQQLDADATRMAAFPSRDRAAFDAHWATNILGNPATAKQTILVDGQVAGHIGSWSQDGVRLVGYWIGKEYWGKGVATRALAAFLHLVTERPLHAHVAKHNVGSIRVLEKCGFSLEREESAELTGQDVAEVVLVLR